MFHVQNVYSSHNTGKSAVFERLVGRFGNKCTYVSIGDSPEDEDASKKVRIGTETRSPSKPFN